jgi:hypothetical protein
MSPLSRRLVACAAGAVATAAASSAHAAVCSSLALVAPRVVIENGDTQEPMLKALGQQLANAPQPIRIVYFNKSTCLLAADAYNGTPIPETTLMSYIPSTTEDPAWDPTKPSPTCNPDPGGYAIDLAIGATYLTSCKALPAKPATLNLIPGHVQAYGFVVPTASTQKAITAEEGYFSFGFPAATGQAAPWTDQTLRFIRGPGASTALTVSANISLDPAKLQGTLLNPDRSSSVRTSVSTSGTPEATIGIMGVDVYDQSRTILRMLAFRAFHQLYAYYPDSTNLAFDKQNVRDGHWVPWSPTQYIISATPTADAQRVLDLLFGNRFDPGVNGFASVVQNGQVPQCAMKVQRAFDGGEFSLYDDPAPCDCFFESNYPGHGNTCTVCADDTVCGGGGKKCRRGFCERK